MVSYQGVEYGVGPHISKISFDIHDLGRFALRGKHLSFDFDPVSANFCTKISHQGLLKVAISQSDFEVKQTLNQFCKPSQGLSNANCN